MRVGYAAPQPDAIFLRDNGDRSLDFHRDQMKAALLRLEKHLRSWPLFVHGKSKRGSIVVYRPLLPAATMELYGPESDLRIDAILLQHLLQTVPPKTRFLLVIDMQQVADRVRTLLAPRHLAALHEKSSIMHFVKSPEWQVVRKMFFRKSICEGIILINVPAVFQQVQAILNYLLFQQRVGSRREKVTPSDEREFGLAQSGEPQLLQSSQDETALYAAVDLPEMPVEYALKLKGAATAGLSDSIAAGTDENAPSSGDEYEKTGFPALSSLLHLGKAPEHIIFCAALSPTLLEMGAEEARSNVFVFAPRSTTVATPQLKLQQGGRQQHTIDPRVSKSEASMVSEEPADVSGLLPKKEPKPPPPPTLASPQKELYPAHLVQRIRRVSKELLRPFAFVASERTQGDLSKAELSTGISSVILPSDIAGELSSPTPSVRRSSVLPSPVRQMPGAVPSLRRPVLQPAENRRTVWKGGNASTKRRRSTRAQAHSTHKRVARGTKKNSRRSTSAGRASKVKTADREPGRLDAHSNNHNAQTLSRRRRDSTALPESRALEKNHGVSQKERTRRIAAVTRKVHETKLPQRCTRRTKESFADQSFPPNPILPERAIQESHTTLSQKTAVLSLVKEASEGDFTPGMAECGKYRQQRTTARVDAWPEIPQSDADHTERSHSANGKSGHETTSSVECKEELNAASSTTVERPRRDDERRKEQNSASNSTEEMPQRHDGKSRLTGSDWITQDCNDVLSITGEARWTGQAPYSGTAGINAYSVGRSGQRVSQCARDGRKTTFEQTSVAPLRERTMYRGYLSSANGEEGDFDDIS